VTKGQPVLATSEVWADTFLPWLDLSENMAVRNVLTDKEVKLVEQRGQVGVLASEALEVLPFAVLLAEKHE
jgi:hypothetical protein